MIDHYEESPCYYTLKTLKMAKAFLINYEYIEDKIELSEILIKINSIKELKEKIDSSNALDVYAMIVL